MQSSNVTVWLWVICRLCSIFSLLCGPGLLIPLHEQWRTQTDTVYVCVHVCECLHVHVYICIHVHKLRLLPEWWKVQAHIHIKEVIRT